MISIFSGDVRCAMRARDLVWLTLRAEFCYEEPEGGREGGRAKLIPNAFRLFERTKWLSSGVDEDGSPAHWLAGWLAARQGIDQTTTPGAFVRFKGSHPIMSAREREARSKRPLSPFERVERLTGSRA